MKIRYYGVRGSIPTPLLPHELEKKFVKLFSGILAHKEYRGMKLKEVLGKLPFHLKSTYGGNTPCIYIQIEKEHLIFDAGSGLRELGFDLLKEGFGEGKGTARFFFSHTHWDHIQGFPFFVPFFIPGNRFEFYSCVPDLEERLKTQLAPRHFPIDMDYMQAEKKYIQLSPETPKRFEGFTVDTLKQNHPGDSFAYRVDAGGKKFVYSTDVEYNEKNYDQLHKAIEFARNADVLTFDSQYTLMEALNKPDWGHSSIQMGIDIAHDAGIKRVVLFHYDPTYTDEKIFETVKVGVTYKDTLYPDSGIEVIPSYEGLEIVL